MSEELIVWIEILFNISYLIAICALVFLMWRKRGDLSPEIRRQADPAAAAFALLALGDTGHVGFRVWAYALGGLESTVALAGTRLGLVGTGALMTAVTVTLFYVLMLECWRVRFKRSYGWFEVFLLAAAAVRLVLLAMPQNSWGSVMPPQPWSTIRNIPLTIQGLGLAALVLRDGAAYQDTPFKWIGVSILVSFGCYIPVILFVQQVPMIGMLMIPKTVAYLLIGILAYRNLYHKPLAVEDALLVHA
jgi:hypothetical protein